jgi:hypothetical protein
LIQSSPAADAMSSPLCLFTLRSSTRLCWTADAVGLICLRFGLGNQGANGAAIVNVIEVMSNRDGSSLMTMLSVGGASTPRSAWSWSWRRLTAWGMARCTVSLATSYFENLAKTMALEVLRPGCFTSFRTACSTFFWCMTLFFDMLGSCQYSVETDLNNKWRWNMDQTCGAQCFVRSLDGRSRCIWVQCWQPGWRRMTMITYSKMTVRSSPTMIYSLMEQQI